MKPIIYKDQAYEITTEANDIRLEGFHQDLTLIGAYLELKREAIDEVGYYRPDTLSDWDGDTFDYDKDEVEYYIDQNLEDYVEKWLKDAKQIEVLAHNSN